MSTVAAVILESKVLFNNNKIPSRGGFKYKTPAGNVMFNEQKVNTRKITAWIRVNEIGQVTRHLIF